MNLIEVAQYEQATGSSRVQDSTSVPEWMLGAFRRHCISFADGRSDTDTRVYWLQSRGLTIDIRLPTVTDQRRLPSVNLDQLSTLKGLSDLEGWCARTHWRDQRLSWSGGVSFQLHNRWPESAELKRIGNCMMEFAPSGAYVEDWRLLNTSGEGPLIGLELESETDLDSGETSDRGGALIVNGHFAAMVLGRSDRTLERRLQDSGQSLWMALSETNAAERTDLLDFQTVVAERQPAGPQAQQAHPEDRFEIKHSLYPITPGQECLNLGGFSAPDRNGRISQRIDADGRQLTRVWRVDCLEPSHRYAIETQLSDTAAVEWRQQESATLDRYTRWLT